MHWNIYSCLKYNQYVNVLMNGITCLDMFHCRRENDNIGIDIDEFTLMIILNTSS